MKRDRVKSFEEQTRRITALVVRGQLSVAKAKTFIRWAADDEVIRRLAEQMPKMYARTKKVLDTEQEEEGKR